jgi:hypothetical protein
LTASDFPLRHHFEERKAEKDPRCVRCGIFLSKIVSVDGHSIAPCAKDRGTAIADHFCETVAMELHAIASMYGKIDATMILALLVNLSAVTALEGAMPAEDFVRLAEMAYEGMLKEGAS